MEKMKIWPIISPNNEFEVCRRRFGAFDGAESIPDAQIGRKRRFKADYGRFPENGPYASPGTQKSGVLYGFFERNPIFTSGGPGTWHSGEKY